MSDPIVVAPAIREMDGIAALPRANGELVFAAPWEGRAFGAAVGAVAALGLEWDDFRQQLVGAIAAAPDRPYYESWVVALEAFVVAQGIATASELDARAHAHS